MRLSALFCLFAIVQLALLANVQARVSASDSAISAGSFSSWASSLLCTSAAVGPKQLCAPNVEDTGGFLDFQMASNSRTSLAFNVERTTVEVATLLRSYWIQPLYARLSAVANSAASCDSGTVTGLFGSQLSDPLVSATFSANNASACNVSSLDIALASAAVSYKGISPARVASYISLRSGSSRVHGANTNSIPPAFDARALPLVAVAHGARVFVIVIDGSLASDSNALRVLVQTAIRLTAGSDMLQLIWATSSGPALPLCRESVTPALATAELKHCLIKMTRDMGFSGLAQMSRAMSMVEEIVTASGGVKRVEVVLFASSSSPAFPFADVYQGTGCVGRLSSSLAQCPYRTMLAVSINSTSVTSQSLIIHSVILTPKVSVRFPQITCRSTGAAVFINSSLCSSPSKCTSALAPIFMSVSGSFVEFGRSSPIAWLPADEKCSLRLASGLPLSCGPTLSYSSYVSMSAGANVVAGVSSVELHPIELYDVLREIMANVSLTVHGMTPINVETLLVHVASGVVIGSSRLSTLSPNKDAKWAQDSYLDTPNVLLENGFKNFIPCCNGAGCSCPSGQPNRVYINDVTTKYQIPLTILNFRNVTCSAAAPGVAACSALLDVNIAVVVIAQGRRTVSSSQVLLSGDKMPNFVNFPVVVTPAVPLAVGLCPSNMILSRAAQLIGASPLCAHIFRSDSLVWYCRNKISLHFSPSSWRASVTALQGLDSTQIQQVTDFLGGRASSFLLPFSGLHSFAIVGSAIAYGLMLTATVPSNDVLSVFFGYRQGVFVSKPARAVPPGFDHTLSDWFVSCASITYATANSFDASSFPVRFVILPLRQSFAAQSAQQPMPPVFVIARPVFYPESSSQESDRDNFVGVFGVEVDMVSFSAVFNQNEICRFDSSNCMLADIEGWILMDKYLQDPLTAMSTIEQQRQSEYASDALGQQRPLRLHLSRQYKSLYRALLGRGIAQSSTVSQPLQGRLLLETTLFRINPSALPAVFELADEGVSVSISLVPWSNAVLFVLVGSVALVPNAAASFGCGYSLALDRLQPMDLLDDAAAPFPQNVLRQLFVRNPYPRDMGALALPWASQWSAEIVQLQYVPQSSGADPAPQIFNETFISDNADFFKGTINLFAVHVCDGLGLAFTAILASVFAIFGLLVLLALVYKHFQAVHRLFNIAVQMSLDSRNLSYFLYLLSKVEAAQRTISGVTIFDPVLHMSSLSVQQHVASSAEDAAESKPSAVAAKLPDWEREGRLWNALKVKLTAAIDESEYSAALEELSSVSIMSSFMNASLLLASLSEYNGATRSKMWPYIDLLKDSTSALSTRLQRLEMIGVVLVSIQSMVEKLQAHTDKAATSAPEVFNVTSGSSVQFMARHYSDVLSPQLGQARDVHMARRIVSTALAISQTTVGSSQITPDTEPDPHPFSPAVEVTQDAHDPFAVDELCLESARSSSSQAGGYFVDPSVIVIPSGSVSSAAIPLRLNAAGRHEQQASMWRRAYLGRLHREIQDDVSPASIQAENWALTALRAHASQHGHIDADDPDQLLADSDMPSPVTNRSVSPLRRRIRRDEEGEAAFGTPRANLSGGNVQTNTGLGAALLSIFNDIVADSSIHGGQSMILNPSPPQPQNHSESSSDHLENGINMRSSDFPDGNVFAESFGEISSAIPSYDELTQRTGPEVDAETSDRSVASHDSLQDVDVGQHAPVSIFIAPPENCRVDVGQHAPVSIFIAPPEDNPGGITPRRVKAQLPQSVGQGQVHADFSDAVTAPVGGGMTPRRAKQKTMGQDLKAAVAVDIVGSLSHRVDVCAASDQEMDM